MLDAARPMPECAMEPIALPASRSPRARVFKLILERSFERRRVKLASGKWSDFYLDMKPTMFHPEALTLLSRMVLDRLKDTRFDCIGGLEMGAVPLIAPVSLYALQKRGRAIPGFFVRKEVKTHGTRKRVEGCGVKGQRAVILEDVTTTGGSAMQAVEAVRQEGGEVAMVLSIVDREEGAVELYRERGIPFDSLFQASAFLDATKPPAN
jgi:orotate phosphoribosyltransferase